MTRELKSRLTAAAYSLQFPVTLSLADGSGKIDRYIQQGVSGVSAENAPFRRRIDLWGLGLAVGLAENLSPFEGDMRKFVDTRNVEVSEHLAAIIFIAAVSRLGADNPELDDTSTVVATCNRIAGAGVDEILNWFENDSMATTSLTSVLRHAGGLRQRIAENAVGVAH